MLSANASLRSTSTVGSQITVPNHRAGFRAAPVRPDAHSDAAMPHKPTHKGDSQRPTGPRSFGARGSTRVAKTTSVRTNVRQISTARLLGKAATVIVLRSHAFKFTCGVPIRAA